MSERRKSHALPIALVLLLLLLPTAYIATYYAMLEGQISLASPPAFGVPFDLMLEPVYRWDHPIVATTLEPAHQIDRIIRPSYWHSE